MHELPITQSILDIALKHADDAPIVAIHLVIGDLSSFIDESIRFYWDIISEGTPAHGAMLHFERIPAQFACEQCGAVYYPKEAGLLCPTCGGHRTKILAGEEFYVKAIDIKEKTP